MKRKEIIIIISVLAISLALLAPRFFGGFADEKRLIIEVQDNIVKEMMISSSTTENIIVELDNGEAIIAIQEGKVRVLPMPKHICPNGICSATGWIEKPGEVIVCLPNKMVVLIKE